MGVRTEGDTVYVDHTSVEKLIQAMFVESQQRSRSDNHRAFAPSAPIRGSDSHGHHPLPRYIEWMDIGRVIPNAEVMSIGKKTAVFAVWRASRLRAVCG